MSCRTHLELGRGSLALISSELRTNVRVDNEKQRVSRRTSAAGAWGPAATATAVRRSTRVDTARRRRQGNDSHLETPYRRLYRRRR